MTNEEKASLRSALAELVKKRRRLHPNVIIDTERRLNEDDGQFFTSRAEILIFDLPEDQLHELHVARDAYEGLIDLHIGLPQEVMELVIKARSICPPLRFYGQQFPFKIHNDEEQTFQWFAKEFMSLPYRASHSFWHKQGFNKIHLTSFADERPSLKAQ